MWLHQQLYLEMTQMTPDHRGIIAHPSSISQRASSFDSDCSLSAYASSKQQDLSDACSTVSSDLDVDVSSAASNFDFDLDLLPVLADCQVPSLELPFPELDCRSTEKNSCNSFCADDEDALGNCCGLSQQVPSPSNTLSPISHAHSPTMFSPGGGGGGGGMDNNSSSCKAATAAQTNTVTKYSPYAEAAVASSRTAGGRRLSSAASTASNSSSMAPPPQFSLLESLAEFNALQNRIKVERESVPSPPSYAESTSAGSAKTIVKAEPATAAAGPSTSSAMPPPPYNYYGGCVIKSETAQESDAEMEDSDNAPFHKMDPVLSLVMEQARKDIDFTCSALSISNDPSAWSRPDLDRWIRWTMSQYNIPDPSGAVAQQWAATAVGEEMDGQRFLQLSEQDFRDRMPQGGDDLYAQLEIWRATAAAATSVEAAASTASATASTSYSQPQPHLATAGHNLAAPGHTEKKPLQKEDSLDISYVLQMLEGPASTTAAASPALLTTAAASVTLHASQQHQQHQPPPPYPYAQQGQQQQDGEALEESEDEETDSSPATIGSAASSPMPSSSSSSAVPKSSPSATATGSTGRSTTSIHLWQFVKELLLQPQLYSASIHWVDREAGIFKIVDSNRVATLWGKRKNRPAMNYDKLSRSLRQYYKKGIMKKTERTQRLVYQFCHPYHL